MVAQSDAFSVFLPPSHSHNKALQRCTVGFTSSVATFCVHNILQPSATKLYRCEQQCHAKMVAAIFKVMVLVTMRFEYVNVCACPTSSELLNALRPAGVCWCVARQSAVGKVGIAFFNVKITGFETLSHGHLPHTLLNR